CLAAEWTYQLGAVGRHVAARDADSPAVRDRAEFVGLRVGHAPEPERAFLAGAERLTALAIGHPLRKERADVLGDLVELFGRDLRRLVAHGEAAGLEIGLDRHDSRAGPQAIDQDLEAALALGHRHVPGDLGLDGGGFDAWIHRDKP